MSNQQGRYASGPQPAQPRPMNLGLVAGMVALGVVAALLVWWLVEGRKPAEPPVIPTSPSSPTSSFSLPPPTPTQTPSQAPSPTSTKPAGIEHVPSTRTPPWTQLRTEPRTTMAPLVAVGEPAEIIGSDGSVGLITVLRHEWLPLDGLRQPAPGYAFLAIEVQFEAVVGELRYSPPRAFVADANGGRYGFFYSSHYTEHPQFEIDTLDEGEQVTGWILFEIPQADSTFVYSGEDEESTRVLLTGGEPPVLAPPPIPLGQQFVDEGYSTYGTVDVIGAAWFTEGRNTQPRPGNEYLAVQVRGTAGADQGFSLSPHNFALRAADGSEVEPAFIESDQYRPSLDSHYLAPGDQMMGWIIYELPRAESTLVFQGWAGEEIGSVTIQA